MSLCGCGIADTKVGGFEGASRVREEYSGYFLALCVESYGRRMPFFSSIQYCPWCGTDLRARKESIDGRKEKTRPEEEQAS